MDVPQQVIIDDNLCLIFPYLLGKDHHTQSNSKVYRLVVQDRQNNGFIESLENWNEVGTKSGGSTEWL